MRTMDSKECGTVGKVVVVPHTKSCIRSSVMRIIPEDLTVVSIDTSGCLWVFSLVTAMMACIGIVHQRRGQT